jgi:hypothetical protein
LPPTSGKWSYLIADSNSTLSFGSSLWRDASRRFQDSYDLASSLWRDSLDLIVSPQSEQAIVTSTSTDLFASDLWRWSVSHCRQQQHAFVVESLAGCLSSLSGRYIGLESLVRFLGCHHVAQSEQVVNSFEHESVCIESGDVRFAVSGKVSNVCGSVSPRLLGAFPRVQDCGNNVLAWFATLQNSACCLPLHYHGVDPEVVSSTLSSRGSWSSSPSGACSFALVFPHGWRVASHVQLYWR